jgi:hypothetical protein
LPGMHPVTRILLTGEQRMVILAVTENYRMDLGSGAGVVVFGLYLCVDLCAALARLALVGSVGPNTAHIAFVSSVRRAVGSALSAIL